MNNTRNENMRTEEERHEADALKRLLHAGTQGDQDACGNLASDLSGIVLIWLHNHPRYARGLSLCERRALCSIGP